jgi:UDP-N-acetyl-D-glucosamine dehydrogenase
MNVTIVGQGYVGLPLAMAACAAGYTVFGLDQNKEKIAILQSGKSSIEDVDNGEVQRYLDEKRYFPTTESQKLSLSQIIILCVPTPLDEFRRPDLNILIEATKTVAKKLTKGSLVIIESTIAPGTCRDLLYPLLITESMLTHGEFFFAYSPERIDPMNKKWTITNTPKLIAGIDQASVNKAKEFYLKFISSVHECQTLEVAETAKLLENTFRFVNISMVNELLVICQKIGVDLNEVIRAAATKPYGFMPFYPSVGVGGHCIPVDPMYLSNKANEMGAQTRFIDLANQINQEMPKYFVGRAEEILNGLDGKEILVVGVAYKPNVGDVRETPVQSLVTGLRSKGAQVAWHDDLVNEWNNEKSVELKDGFDLAIIATAHSYLDLLKLGDTPILDTRMSI